MAFISITLRANATSSSDGEYSALTIFTCPGWMQPAPSKPKRRDLRTIARNLSQSLKSATVPMKPSGITPAARAAMIIRCLGCSSTSSSGSMSQFRAKSSPPMFIATTRGQARGISSMRRKASGVSIMVMNFVCPTFMPRFSSSSLTSSSSNRTCEALSALVMARPSTSGQIECSMSRTASDSGWLMRTTTSEPPCRTRAAFFSTRVRAVAFSPGGTASSRSSWITSAARVCALSTNFSTLTGT